MGSLLLGSALPQSASNYGAGYTARSYTGHVLPVRGIRKIRINQRMTTSIVLLVGLNLSLDLSLI